jgi:outer membrane protein assembly factor BamB
MGIGLIACSGVGDRMGSLAGSGPTRPGNTPPPYLGGYGPMYPFPGGPPRRRRRGWLWLVPLIIVIVAAAIVVPIVLNKKDNSPPGSTKSPVADPWQILASKVPPFSKRLAAWSTADSLVVVADHYTASYSRADGAQQWRTPTPEGMIFCGSGTTIVRGQIALAFGKNGDDLSSSSCDNVTVLNVKTGRLKWTQPFTISVKGAGSTPRINALVQIVGDTVVVTRDEGILGFDLATGEQRWTKPLIRQVDGEEYCAGSDMVAKNDSILLTMTCNPSEYDLTILVFDQASGAVIREKTFTRDELGFQRQAGGLESIASVDPLVIYLTGDVVPGGTGVFGLSLQQAYITFDNNFNRTQVIDAGARGAPSALVPAGLDKYGTGLPQHHNVGALVTKGLLVTVTSPLDGKKNSMVAFDLQSGQQKWKAQTQGTIIAPVALDGEDIIAPVGALDYEHNSSQIAKINLNDGTINIVGTYPLNEPRSSFSAPLNDTRFIWADHRLYAIRAKYPDIAAYIPKLFTIYTIG